MILTVANQCCCCFLLTISKSRILLTLQWHSRSLTFIHTQGIHVTNLFLPLLMVCLLTVKYCDPQMDCFFMCPNYHSRFFAVISRVISNGKNWLIMLVPDLTYLRGDRLATLIQCRLVATYTQNDKTASVQKGEK